jgi:hypothetical protein
VTYGFWGKVGHKDLDREMEGGGNGKISFVGANYMIGKMDFVRIFFWQNKADIRFISG